VFFTSGATEAMNLVVRGLTLRRVVVTAAEHNAVLRPLAAMLPDSVIELVPCDESGYVNRKAMKEALVPGIDALLMNHCSNVTGAVQDVRFAAELAHRAGALFIVDAAQSAGVVPIDMERDDVDVLVFTGHKALFGPAGIGGFALREHVELEPVKFGGTGSEGDSVRPAAKRLFEVGTQNAPGIAGLVAGLRFVLETGVETIGRHVAALAGELSGALRALPGVKVYAAPENASSGGAVSFNVSGLDPADLGYILRHSYDMELRTGFQCAPLLMKGLGLDKGVVRASVSYLTPREDVLALIEAVKSIVGGTQG
jgi:selenocysteine lyase/cysteine desulfurase